MTGRVLSLVVLAATVMAMAAGLFGSAQDGYAGGMPYVIDTTSDNPNLYLCSDSPGDCSLRGALTNNNASVNVPGHITFNIPPGGPQTITPQTLLPQITKTVTIDGSTQPGSNQCGGAPCIKIDGGGLSIHSSNVSVRGLAIWNFTDGMGIQVVDGSNISIAGNFLGTPDGLTHAQQDYGVYIASRASNVTVGGTTAADRNVISGNADGVFTSGTNVTIEGNYIGTTGIGSAALSNNTGIDVQGANTTISGNVISGNTNSTNGAGVSFTNGGGVVRGNLIGLNAGGTAAIANDVGVIVHPTSSVTIGGTTANARNVISGNGGAGIMITGQPLNASAVTVEGNYIGTNASGTQSRGNGGSGIVVDGGGVTIIGNTLAANYDGIVISGDQNTPMNSIYQNYVGTNANLASGLGNVHQGVEISGASNIRFGSESAPASGAAAGGNVVWNNAFEGLIMESGTAQHNAILGNSFYNNGTEGLSIQGANNEEAPPVLAAAETVNGQTHVTGTLASTGFFPFTVEFFSSPACDPSRSGEGRDFLGSTTLSVTGGGPIDATVDGAPAGSAITATAMDDGYNSTAFSNCVTLIGPSPTPSPTNSPTPSPSPTPTATPIQHPTPTPSGEPVFGDGNCDGIVDMKDVIAVLSEVAGVDPGAPCGDRADVNCDGGLDADDALRILDFAAGAPMTPVSRCTAIGTPA